MPRKLLIILLFLISTNLVFKASIAADGHAITGLNLSISPKLPRINKAVNSFSATFKLKSKSGIDTNRIKVFVNKTQIQSTGSDFTILDTIDEETVRIQYKPSVNLAFSKEENTFKLEYWLTRVNGKNPLASVEKTIYCQKETNSGGGGSGGGTDNGSTSNGDVIQISKILYLDIEDISTIDNAEVSKTPKQFRLTVEHDENYVPFVDKDFFNANKDVVLKNLKIYAEADGQKAEITDDFEFDLENGSVSSDRDGYLITKYLSNALIIEDPMTLRFRVDLTSYLDKYDVSIPDTINPKSNSKIEITPIQIDLEDLDISSDSLIFTTTSTTRNKYIFKSQDTNLTATFTNPNHVISNTQEVIFTETNSLGKTIKPKIKYKNQISMTIDPGALDEPTISLVNGNTSSYSLTLPFNIILEANKSVFAGAGNPLKNPNKNKTLFLPITIKSISSQNLLMELNGKINQTQSMEFNF